MEDLDRISEGVISTYTFIEGIIVGILGNLLISTMLELYKIALEYVPDFPLSYNWFILIMAFLSLIGLNYIGYQWYKLYRHGIRNYQDTLKEIYDRTIEQ